MSAEVRIMSKYDTYVNDRYVEENKFIAREVEEAPLPLFDDIKNQLPKPVWEGHEDTVACYYKAWELAFGNLRKPVPDTGFITNFIDTAFNGCLFMWDSSFILMFGKYAKKIFDFQKTLDNFYAKQHSDGFICREIVEATGEDRFERFNPVSTGPNIMPWCEWEYFKINGDTKRLSEVFPVLLAYHRWLMQYRTWRDGSYWSSGWGCGMDNMPRLQKGWHVEFSHGHMVWADTCFQQLLSADILIKMAEVLGREAEVSELEEERARLGKFVNEQLWDTKSEFYYDLWKNDEFNYVKSIGAYWALLADVVPADRLDSFVAHLENENEFNRPHRVPTVSADSECYEPKGGYWRGSVWAPTNYMVLKGLEKNNYFDLAYDIALSHVKNVTAVYNETGTVFENYAPECTEKGELAKDDFVGWTGLSPISILFEYVFGIISDAASNKITWRINCLERHGILKYPLGENAVVDLICEKRNNRDEKPVVTVKSNIPVEVDIIWNGKTETIKA